MEHRSGRGVAVLFITFGLILTVQGDSSDLSAPQFVRVINKPRTTSAEIQVQRLINGHIYEPCAGGHVVHFRFSGEMDWHFANTTEKIGGRFTLTGLLPGTNYEIRVACKDMKTPPSVGAWSDPTSVVTPLTNPKGDGGHPDEHGELSGNGKGKEGSSGRTFASTTTLLAAATFIAFNYC